MSIITREFAGSTNVYSVRQREAGCVIQCAAGTRSESVDTTENSHDFS